MNGKKNRNWNRKIALVCTAVGMIVLLGGLLAAGFKVMSMAVALCIAALIFTGYMTVVPGFILIGAYFLGQAAFIFTLVKLERTM